MRKEDDLRQCLREREAFAPDSTAVVATVLEVGRRNARTRRWRPVGLVAAVVCVIGVAASLLAMLLPNQTHSGGPIIDRTALIGSWDLKELRTADGTILPLPPKSAHGGRAVFRDDGTLTVHLSCNSSTGTFRVDGSTIEWPDPAATAAYCDVPGLTDNDRSARHTFDETITALWLGVVSASVEEPTLSVQGHGYAADYVRSP